MRTKGKVKFYNAEKKFGFIQVEGETKDIHFGPDSFRGDPPSIGDEVEFEIMEEPRGPHAKKMQVISGGDPTIIPPQSHAKSFHQNERKLFLPTDTQSVFDWDSIDNFSLKLNKAAPYFADEPAGFKFFKMDKKGNKLIEILPKYTEKIIEVILKRFLMSVKALNLEVKDQIFIPDWRLIVGLGTDSVYETGITLHHIYGFPYIPGQAIKGVLRSWIINGFFHQNEGNKKEGAYSDKLFCDIFGCPSDSAYKEARQGKVWFFDALPANTPTIEVDVMNPHYSKYYGGDKPPADYLDPVPIPFLTVSKETGFCFLIGVSKKQELSFKVSSYKTSPIVKYLEKEGGVKVDSSLLDISMTLLKDALKEQGVGAKSAVGYGYFEQVL
ncbi:MAG: type III-B CRISPR module RAMP protein Cmr6 [Candidatus Brocadia sp. WS118]|nr:MAG: type III-B CRISPR module RAMP protein Cmr6 [Candidatus Brocadia sp. WS118]